MNMRAASRRVATTKRTPDNSLKCDECGLPAVAKVGLPHADARYVCRQHFDEWLEGRST